VISIQIGDSAEARYEDTTESWINQQINQRRRDGITPCVRVRIKTPDVDVGLTTPQCGSMGGGRAPTSREAQIIELWRKRGLVDQEFTGGSVIAFLRQVQSLL
jgi:hypothetical protein